MRKLAIAVLLLAGLVSCAKRPVAIASPSDNLSAECAKAHAVAKDNGTVERTVTDVKMTRAQMIEQDNARGPGREEIPSGAYGAEVLSVCSFDGDFGNSGDRHGGNVKVTRYTFIVEANGFTWVRSSGAKERMTTFVAP
jgi:hypothetical protein